MEHFKTKHFRSFFYFLAFGLFFEWTDSDENEVSVHISDSEDEGNLEYFNFTKKIKKKIYFLKCFLNVCLDVDDEYHDEDGDLENGGSVNQALVQKG